MQPSWMTHAWARFGVREAPGGANNPVIVDFYRDAGHANITRDAVPWCAAFVGACLERAGIAGTDSLLARSYLGWGVAAEAAGWGTVAVLSRGSDPAAGHVGFVVGETARDLYLLGGNQSDAVNVARFPKSRLLGLRTASEAAVQAPSADAFDEALIHVLAMEGGFTNDPHDPGGPTNRGITLATFARHLGHSLTPANRDRNIQLLKSISDDTVRAIYLTRYWMPSRAREMPAGVDLMHFDASVNNGLTGAAKILQAAVRVEVDGEIGPVTMAAIHNASSEALISRYGELRAERYRSLDHFWRFGRGWLRRVDATRAAAMARAVGAERGIHASQTGKNGDANMSESVSSGTGSPPASPSKSPSEIKWWGNSLTIRGALLTFLTTVLPVIAPLFGFNITGEIIEQIGSHSTALVQAVGGLVGIALTILGRTRATSRLARMPMEIRI